MMTPTVPPGIDSLPPWVQVTITILVFCSALFISFRSVFKPTGSEVAKSKDVVVPNVNVMDGQIFAQATEQLKASMRAQEARDVQVRELQRELGHQSEIMRDCLQALRECVGHLEAIDRKLRQELRRQAEEAGR
jgi:hypothetical protein